MKQGFFNCSILSVFKIPLRLFSFFYVFTGSSLFAQQIINKSGAIIMSGAVTMVVKNASFINNSIFAAGKYSNAIFTGTAAYSIGTSGAIVDSTNFYNLYITNSALGTIKPYVGVQDTISVTAGSINSGGNLTLLSTLAGTANVSAATVANSITGNVNVQRYIPSKRAWRLLTAPVAVANSIFTTWQNSGNYVVGRGMFLSGPAAVNVLPSTTNNGLDYSNRKNSSMKTWDYTLATPNFVAVSNSNTSISLPTVTSAANIGYFVFVRGDRAPTNINNVINTTITTLTSIGALQTGTQTFTIPAATATGSYVLLGNPYAAPIDFNKVTLSNVYKTFYTWDPSINSLGAYVAVGYDPVARTYTAVPNSGSTLQSQIIQSGQAFFVQTIATGNTTTVAFSETNKSATYANNTGFRPMEPASPESISGSLAANLYFIEKDSTLQLADGNLTKFNNDFSDKISQVEDAVKFTNLNEGFGLLRHGATLAIEGRPNLSTTDTLFLKLCKTTQRAYRFVFEPKHLNKVNLMGYLQDKYLNTSAEISLASNTAINFEVGANIASAAADRFQIVFKTILPFKFSGVTAYKNNSDIAVEWKVSNETDIVKYEVEKSTNGTDFTKVNTHLVNGNNNDTNNYIWLDENAQTGDNIYRIKMLGKDGSTKFSENVIVVVVATNTGITIYPNPIKEGKIHLQMGNQPAGNYQLSVTNNSGQVIYSGTVQNNGNSSNFLINIKPAPLTGLYSLQIINPQNKISTQKIIVN